MDFMARYHRIITTTIVLVFLAFVSCAYAQEVLKGKYIIGGGTCTFTKEGQMSKDGVIEKPCFIAIDPAIENVAYAIVLDNNGNYVEVVEMDLVKKTNRSVWRKGQVDA